MSWIILFFAGLMEVAWVITMKYSNGFTKPIPTLLTILFLTISIGLLGVSIRYLPMGTAYAVWTGIGTIGTVILGVVLFGEPTTVLRFTCIGLILAGIVGLKLSY